MNDLDRRDSGFTLIELLVSISILGVIVSAISAALIVFLSNAEYATNRDDHSAGAALLATYADRDLASAELATTGSTVPCAAGAMALRLEWTEVTASPAAPAPTSGTTYFVGYQVGTDPDDSSRKRVTRFYCGGSTLLRTTVIVSNLASADFATTSSAICVKGTPLVIRLGAYADDTTADFSYSGCVRGRLL